MSAKKRTTHPRQIAALTRRTSPPGADDADGLYGWVGELPNKVRRRRADSGMSPTSSVPPVSEPPPDSMPPASAPRRREGVQGPVPEPRIEFGADDAFDRRPTLKIKAVTQEELDEVDFDEEVVVDVAVEEPSSHAEQAPDSEPWPDLELDLPPSASQAKPATDDEPLDDKSSIDRLLGIAHSIDEVLESSPPAPHEAPIRVSLPLFAAVNLEPPDKLKK